MREERSDMEASLLRAKREAALADGISWGMDEDAVEENEVCKGLGTFFYRCIDFILFIYLCVCVCV